MPTRTGEVKRSLCDKSSQEIWRLQWRPSHSPAHCHFPHRLNSTAWHWFYHQQLLPAARSAARSTATTRTRRTTGCSSLSARRCVGPVVVRVTHAVVLALTSKGGSRVGGATLPGPLHGAGPRRERRVCRHAHQPHRAHVRQGPPPYPRRGTNGACPPPHALPLSAAIHCLSPAAVRMTQPTR